MSDVLVWGAVLLGFAGMAGASPFEQAASLSVMAEYDSNPAMLEDEVSVWRGIVEPGYRLRWKRGSYDLDATAALRVERSDDTDISSDREDPTVAVSAEREHARGLWQANASYAEASTRLTELEDTGVLFLDGTRKEFAAEIGFEHDLSERLGFELATSYEDTSFDDDVFISYESVQASGILNYAFGITTNGWIETVFSTYDPDEVMVESSDGRAVLVGTSHRFSESLALEGYGGIVDISGDTDSNDWTAGVTFNYLGDRTTFETQYARDIAPSASGGFEKADTYRASLVRRLTELSTLVLNLHWRENLRRDSSDTYTAEIRFDRRLARDWTLGMGVMQRGSRSGENDIGEIAGEGNITGEVVTLSLTYRPPSRL